MSAVELAREGLNRSCVNCGDRPLFGGMRCLGCFRLRVEARHGQHQSFEPATYGTYAAGCRCRECKAASAAYQRKRRSS